MNFKMKSVEILHMLDLIFKIIYKDTSMQIVAANVRNKKKKKGNLILVMLIQGSC